MRHTACGARAICLTLDNRTEGQPITTRSLRRVVDSYLEETGLKESGISFHSLRHSFATRSLAGGAKLLSIGQVLGHSSVETTQVCAKVVDRIRQNRATYLEELMGGGRS
jgi:integrase/recombinase XerD